MNSMKHASVLSLELNSMHADGNFFSSYVNLALYTMHKM